MTSNSLLQGKNSFAVKLNNTNKNILKKNCWCMSLVLFAFWNYLAKCKISRSTQPELMNDAVETVGHCEGLSNGFSDRSPGREKPRNFPKQVKSIRLSSRYSFRYAVHISLIHVRPAEREKTSTRRPTPDPPSNYEYQLFLRLFWRSS